MRLSEIGSGNLFLSLNSQLLGIYRLYPEKRVTSYNLYYVNKSNILALFGIKLLNLMIVDI